MSRARLAPPETWVPITGLVDGMGYAYAVSEDATLVVVAASVRNRRVGPVSEDGKALFDQAALRSWWLRLVGQGALPGFHTMPLLPVFWDVRRAFKAWPRRFAGILYYQTTADLRAALKEMAAWVDNVGTDIERVVVSLRGTVPLEEIRPTLDGYLDARFRIVID